jgi:hypothetical protein
MTAFAPRSVLAHRPRPALMLPLLAALVGAGFGWILRDDGARTPHATATQQPAVAAGDLRLTLPDGWARARSGPVVPGLDPAKAAFVRGLSADVAIALLPPASPSLLPPGLTARHAPIVHRAGAVRAYHYVNVLDSYPRRVTDVYVAPTTRGTATVACSTVVYTLGEDCDLVMSLLRLAHGSFLPIGPDAAFLERLPAVVAALRARRAPLRARLAAKPSATAAAQLADAYAAAARALRPLVAPGTAAAATVGLLDRLRAAHAALTTALRADDRARFAAAADAIRTDEARLSRRLAAWQRVLPDAR